MIHIIPPILASNIFKDGNYATVYSNHYHHRRCHCLPRSFVYRSMLLDLLSGEVNIALLSNNDNNDTNHYNNDENTSCHTNGYDNDENILAMHDPETMHALSIRIQSCLNHKIRVGTTRYALLQMTNERRRKERTSKSLDLFFHHSLLSSSSSLSLPS